MDLYTVIKQLILRNGNHVKIKRKNSTPDRGLRSCPDLDPDLGWPWKSYGRECLIDLNKYHYFHCGRTDVRTYGRTYVQTDGHFYQVY